MEPYETLACIDCESLPSRVTDTGGTIHITADTEAELDFRQYVRCGVCEQMWGHYPVIVTIEG